MKKSRMERCIPESLGSESQKERLSNEQAAAAFERHSLCGLAHSALASVPGSAEESLLAWSWQLFVSAVSTSVGPMVLAVLRMPGVPLTEAYCYH